MKVRSAWVLLACVKVKLPFLTVVRYVVAIAAAASAVVGQRKTPESEAQLWSTTVVVVALTASVSVPMPLDLPAASCCSDRAYFDRSFSWEDGAYAVTSSCPQSSCRPRRLRGSSM